jgi:MFS family permease
MSPNAPGADYELRAFWLYWASTTISYLGDGMRFVALPLLAITLTSSPARVASVMVAAGLPWPLLGLVAGIVVDRWDKNRLLVSTQAIRAALGFLTAFGVAAGQVSLIILVAFVFALNSCEVFYDVALHSYLPAIVDQTRLQWANSKLITAETVVFEFVGPAAGGFLFAKSTSLPFFFDAATFLFSAWVLRALSRLRRPFVAPVPAVPEPVGRSSIRSELADGLHWFSSHDLVRSLTFAAAFSNLGTGGLFAVLALFLKKDIGGGADTYGLLIALSVIGSVAGGLVASRLTRSGARRAICLSAAPVTALFLFVIAGSVSYVATAISLIASGLFVALVNVIAISLRQTLIPTDLIGRVTALHRVLCWGALPLGAILTGLVGQLLGVRTAISVCGAAILLLSAITLPSFRRVPSKAYIHETD